MNIFGFSITRIKNRLLSAVNSAGSGGWFNVIREPFAGAWQAGITADAPRQILAFSAVFSCITIISSDVAKLGICLKQKIEGISYDAIQTSPYWKVLRKPNRFQTWYKFIEQWMTCKLLYGNAYILKERDARGIVVAMYVLDSQRVTPLVADDGGVYYELAKDYLASLPEPVTLPASEIIHDMMVSLWHPLVGVTPIYACAVSATMGNRIQQNSTTFFGNMSRPSGSLTSPGTISDETANRLKATFEEQFGGGKIGRLLVAGDGLKYEPMTIPADDAQLIDQLKWTIEDVARCFHVPMFKLGGAVPVGVTVESLNQTYYADCLQALIESAEALLYEGLELPTNYCVEFEEDDLLRMDKATRYKMKGQAVKDGWLAPNEARSSEDMAPVEGGDECYLQQQNFSLRALAKRDAKADPFESGTAKSPSSAPQSEGQISGAQAQQLVEKFVKGLETNAVAVV